ncbi:aspartate/glutamate racemase family protein [Aminobacter sp. MDW-2]|nr:amino acid racemase [Aminobacter sp. MDW-2]QNH37068.1 aspartate/glutamate racemase family protein [Aminobacter sp. MDW-2]
MLRAPLRKVGIIGGMGPEATVLLMAKVIERTSATDDADHVPMFVDNNTQVPSRIKALIEGGGEDPGPVLANMARGLEVAGAEALAMPCNTAHNYAPAIVEATTIPFLDMVELAAERVAAMKAGSFSVGILASPAIRLTGIYERAFAKRHITTLFPSDDERMLAAIRAIKISSANAAARETLSVAADELIKAGADALLVACSEFSIVTDAISGKYRVVDSIDVLADAIVKFATTGLNTSVIR